MGATERIGGERQQTRDTGREGETRGEWEQSSGERVARGTENERWDWKYTVGPEMYCGPASHNKLRTVLQNTSHSHSSRKLQNIVCLYVVAYGVRELHWRKREEAVPALRVMEMADFPAGGRFFSFAVRLSKAFQHCEPIVTEHVVTSSNHQCRR